MKKILALICAAAALAACINRNHNTETGPVLKGDFTDWAQTPPMGWNSWDCYGPTVVEEEVRANADFMAKNLKKFGWEYVIVDIRWFVANDKAGGYNEDDPIYSLDEYGRYIPAVNRFPSSADGAGFKPLSDYVHSLGLKFGIHIMRGVPGKAVEQKLPILGTDGITADMIYSERDRCRWLRDNYTIEADRPGAQEYYNSILELYASWGVDYIKVDDLSAPVYHEHEIDMIRKAIDATGRPIVLSTSPGETPVAAAKHVDSHANAWRMVNDVWDRWQDVTHLIKVARDWYPYIGEGTWPDADMLPLGRISIRGERGTDRNTRLTPDEQRTLMTFWCIFRSPLMYGGDLPSLADDPQGLAMITNEAVLKVNQQGSMPFEVYNKDGKLAVSSFDSVTGHTYLALFNLTDEGPLDLEIPLEELNLKRLRATELWSGKKISGKTVTLAPHACALLELR